MVKHRGDGTHATNAPCRLLVTDVKTFDQLNDDALVGEAISKLLLGVRNLLEFAEKHTHTYYGNASIRMYTAVQKGYLMIMTAGPGLSKLGHVSF